MPDENLIVQVLLLCASLSPFFLLKQYGERPWVRNLFIPLIAGVALSVTEEALKSWDTMRDRIADSATITNSIGIFVGFGFLLFVIGCFCVKIPRFRNGFRWQALIFLTALLVDIGWQEWLSHRWGLAGTINSAVDHAVEMCAFLPLLLLNYRAWKPHPLDNWEADVASLGEETV